MNTAGTAGLLGLTTTMGLIGLLSQQGDAFGLSGQSSLGLQQELSNFCAPRIADANAPGNCMDASSVPTLGMLYPMSVNLNVDPGTNRVGIGTTTPEQKLDVIGNIHTEGDLIFDDDIDGIQFSSVDGNILGGNTPMISMFESGTANADRMVLSHSSAFESWGLRYSDSSDTFTFQRGSTIIAPVLSVGLSSGDVTVHDGRTTVVQSDATQSTLAVRSDVTPNTAVNVLDVQAPTAGFFFFDFLECRSAAGDVEMRVDSNGNLYLDGSVNTPADFAEMIAVSSGAASVEPGDLMVIDPTGERAIVRSSEPRSTLVAGVYSTKPGLVGSEREWDQLEPSGERTELGHADMARLYDEIPMAVVGIVPVKASTENGPIRPGDLLVSSATPGHVMRDPLAPNGTVVGKALTSLESGTGLIRILVTLQ